MLYYVNDKPQTNGDHEVHTDSCSWLPEISNRTYLWNFSNCSDAVKAAKKIYSQSNWCYWCCSACHTS